MNKTVRIPSDHQNWKLHIPHHISLSFSYTDHTPQPPSQSSVVCPHVPPSYYPRKYFRRKKTTERQPASEVRPSSVLASRHGNCRHKPSWNSGRIRNDAKTRCVLQLLVLFGQKWPRRLIRRGMFAPLSLGRRNRHWRRGCCHCGKVEWGGV
jgi:hypothetical protein